MIFIKVANPDILGSHQVLPEISVFASLINITREYEKQVLIISNGQTLYLGVHFDSKSTRKNYI